VISADTVEFVPIGQVRPYERNPRRGDIPAIAESLKVNGQYRPIVVNRRTREILAGNHTWAAAKQLGWKQIAVSYVDVDEEQAKRIVIADNQIHERGRYNPARLHELLSTLPDLDGTGYDRYDLDRLAMLPELNELFSRNSERRYTGQEDGRVRVFIGTYHAFVDDDVYDGWNVKLRAKFADDDKAIRTELRRRVGLGEQLQRKQRVRRVDLSESVEKMTLSTVETVPLKGLTRYPNNPRQGNVTAIAESLAKHGQYRPIVVNRSNQTILVGNHTFTAAKKLGWTDIAVCWVDVDDETAARIVLADNRTAELGTYDDAELTGLLSSIENHDGLGFTAGELRLMLTDLSEDADAGWVIFRVGEYSSPMTPPEFRAWERTQQTTIGYSREEICAAYMKSLGFPKTSYVVSAGIRPPVTLSARRKKAAEA
jgi:ParB-like chromosome segregation protein Spo0J